MMIQRRALITNFDGLGNGILLLPILKQLEQTLENFSYFHTYNPVFEIPILKTEIDLNDYCGHVPAIWRRFDHHNWEAIATFIQQNGINLLINLRDQNSLLDKRYFEFQQEWRSSSLEFWGIHEVIASASHQQHITQSIVDLFNLHEVQVQGYSKHWLQKKYPSPHHNSFYPSSIGFFTAASIPAKRWSAKNWIDLGEMLLENQDCTLIVYAGTSPAEMELAREIVVHLHRKFPETSCLLQEGLSFSQLILSLSKLSLLLSNDSVSIHLATALNIPTIGLYFCTNGTIWGGQGPNFSLLQSKHYLQCAETKEPLGNCLLYYSGCHPSCVETCHLDITPQKVYDLAQYKLTQTVEMRTAVKPLSQFGSCH